jgi:hypothetical protein
MAAATNEKHFFIYWKIWLFFLAAILQRVPDTCMRRHVAIPKNRVAKMKSPMFKYEMGRLKYEKS